ncbi:MAG: hypothetical protein CSA58_08690 [Micrococcales bacterium]|nr:MAG: hypothetical protein CSB46_04530 [Micrococcales bacterium]PIE26561.1 MAG: hypothetical protein CSA58_08690 [Micrococcales bacterium]
MSPHGLPQNKDVKDLLDMLLGKDVVLAPGEPVTSEETPGPTTAVYVDDTNCLSAVVMMDMALTAYAGAAIGLVPAGGAQAALEEWSVPENLQNNAHEVLNVLAALLCDSTDVHQRLYETYTAHEALPGDVVAWSAQPSPRRDVAVEIKGYGTGRLSIVNALP